MNRMLLRVAAAATALFALGHSMGYTHPRLDGEPGMVAAARPLLWATAALQLGFAVVGFRSFFWAPGALNAVSAVCAAVAASRRR